MKLEAVVFEIGNEKKVAQAFLDGEEIKYLSEIEEKMLEKVGAKAKDGEAWVFENSDDKNSAGVEIFLPVYNGLIKDDEKDLINGYNENEFMHVLNNIKEEVKKVKNKKVTIKRIELEV